ncbi:aspartate aminotransferase family protein [Aestuariibacter sp. AA17]|uniref:Aspartate aminotransferase family protein n=1 Tax=Fluctibacter corallii TaxID=2984329 RepID=A0ABT3A731_9ALTE|nr:aspartate aminotransferase family protein [Aestuariibacter sp. AA17]MCV2884420.1 aspartate aminotransferase family protein [Aestuariibacter sp. AA17]
MTSLLHPLSPTSFDARESAASGTDKKDIRQFIFAPENLMQYGIGALQALSSVQSAIASAHKPFSGTSVDSLSQQIAQIDLSTPLSSLNDVMSEVNDIYLKHAVYFHHPHYVAHLNCPVVYPSVIAEQVLSAVNTSVDTWDQSGGATLIEQKLIDWTCDKVGFTASHTSQPDGIFTSGGTQSNLMAMLVARDHAISRVAPNWNAKHDGLPEVTARFKIFTSEKSHFSVQKAAALLGLGYNAVIPVPVDQYYKMDTQALEQLISSTLNEGNIPIAIVATAGTTDFGSIDPLSDMANIASRHEAWFHVDAAYGCGLLLGTHKEACLQGIEHANSVTVDYHKSFMQPVSCSAFLLQDRTHFSHISHHAEYLNPLSDADAGIPNLVDKSLQTTRRFDALKLWMSLRTIGETEIGQGFEAARILARQTFMLLSEDEHFETLHAPELTTLVFRYVPSEYDLTNQQLDEINQSIRDTLTGQGQIMIARTKVNGHYYLKFTLLNPATELEHMRHIIQAIKLAGVQATNNHLPSALSAADQNT